MDMLWLFLAFCYGWMVVVAEIAGLENNIYLSGRRAFVTLIVIAAWFYYVYSDFSAAFDWINTDDSITVDAIQDKTVREFLSLVTSILTTLLIAGYKFGQKETNG